MACDYRHSSEKGPPHDLFYICYSFRHRIFRWILDSKNVSLVVSDWLGQPARAVIYSNFNRFSIRKKNYALHLLGLELLRLENLPSKKDIEKNLRVLCCTGCMFVTTWL